MEPFERSSAPTRARSIFVGSSHAGTDRREGPMHEEAVTQYLKGRGVPDDVAESGLEGLVSAWERTASQVQAGYPLGLDDYLNDVDGRQLIEEAVTATPAAASEALRDR